MCVWHAYMIMPSMPCPRLVAEGQLDEAAQLCEAQPEEWRLRLVETTVEGARATHV